MQQTQLATLSVPPERCSNLLFPARPKKLSLCQGSQHWAPFPQRHQTWWFALCAQHTQSGGATEVGCKVWWMIPTCPFLLHKNLPEAQPALLGILCAIALLHIPLATASLWTGGLLQDQRDTTSHHTAWEEQCPRLCWGAQAMVILCLPVQLHGASLWMWGCLAPASCMHSVSESTRGISSKKDHDN